MFNSLFHYAVCKNYIEAMNASTMVNQADSGGTLTICMLLKTFPFYMARRGNQHDLGLNSQ